MATNPKRGDIWWVSFDPTKGAEMKKTRPAVVISSDAVGVLPVRLVAPITGWKARYAGNLWHVRLDVSEENGLTKTSAVDALQVRSVDTSRFTGRMGRVSAQEIEEIVTAVAAMIEYR